MEEVREIAIRLRRHSSVLQQWPTLVTPCYENAGTDVSYKEAAVALGQMLEDVADSWMSELIDYHLNRAKLVSDVRFQCTQAAWLSG